MLSITAVSGADYWLRSVCHHPNEAHGPADYRLDGASRGEPVGVWAFRGERTLALEGSIIPNAASGDACRTLVNELRDPTQPVRWELDRPPNGQRAWRKDQTPTGAWRHPRLGEAPREFKTVAQRMREFDRRNPDATPEQRRDAQTRAKAQPRQARHAYDLQFSSPKSWSVLHAAWQHQGRNAEADLLWAALMKGVDAALDVVAEQIAHTRSGPGGPQLTTGAPRSTTRFTRNANLVMAMFRHHTSRDREPQLHTHVMLLNRLLCGDDEWRALHAAWLFKSKHMLTQTFLRVAEAEAARTLGLRFATDPVSGWREIVGVDREVREFFSSRSRALSGHAQELAQEYEDTNQRKPDAFTRWKMNQRAAYKNRPPKQKAPPTRQEDLASWQENLAGEIADGLDAVVESVDWVREYEREAPVVVDDEVCERVIEQSLADLTEHMPTWSRSHLWHNLSRRAPDMLAIEPARMPAFLEGLTEQALRRAEVVPVEARPVAEVPTSLRDGRSGRSVFEDPQGERFTTRTHREREDFLVARLGHCGARAVSARAVGESLGGFGLSGEQTDVVVGIRTSGRRVELIDKPAGAGGSRTVAGLSRSLERDTGRGVVGFGLSRNAAEVLRREGIESAHNIAAWLLFWDRAQVGEVSEVERAHFEVAAGSTVVIDEATTADTPQLSRLVRILFDEVCVDQVVMVGDTAQVDAVDAGGAFAMLVREREQEFADARRSGAPDAVPVRRLSEVRRFNHRWEREASARIREGDVTALAEYDIRARITGDVDPEVVKDAAADGFVADHLQGQDSIVVVASDDEAADVASRVRRRLVDAGHVERAGVRLRDGHNAAGVGDIVQTRQNDNALGVDNRDRWQVIGTSSTGDLEVRQLLGGGSRGEIEWGAPRALPAAYVAEHVELAYAATIDAFQGRTTDTAHALVGRTVGRSRYYPATTRGRECNRVYVVLDERQNDAVEQAEERVQVLERRLEHLAGDFNRPVLERSLEHARAELASAREKEETPLGRLAHIVSSDDHTVAARTAIAEEVERSTHLGHLGPQWQALVTEEQAASHRAVIRRAVQGDASRVLEDPSVSGLLHLLRSAEMTGHPVRALLDEAMSEGRGGSLAGTVAPAAALFARVDAILRATPRGREPVGATYEFRTSGAPRTPEGVYALRLARAMDDRTAELARRQSQDPEPWALARFGPVPVDVSERFGWVGRVAAVAAFREQFGWSHPVSPIGPAPTRQNPEKLWAWHRAADVLGIDPAERELSGLSAGELANREQAWARQLEWMPRNVDDELRTAHLALAEATRQVVDARVVGRDVTDLEVTVAEMSAWVDKLEEIAEVRAQAYERTGEVRERAQGARAERERREALERDRLGLAHRDDPGPEEPELDAELDASEGTSEVEAERETAPEPPDPQMAVMARWFANHQPSRAVVFGSPEWTALEASDPAKAAAVTAAAIRSRQLAESGELEELRERMAVQDVEDPAHEVDVEAVTQTHWWSTDHLMVDGPAFGSAEWVALPDGDPGKDAAEAVEALRWWGGGDSLDDQRKRVEAAEARARAAASDVEAGARGPHVEAMDRRAAELARDAERGGFRVPEPEAIEEPNAGPVFDRSRYATTLEAARQVEAVQSEAVAEPEPEPAPVVETSALSEEQARAERDADVDRELARAREARELMAEERAAEQEELAREDELRRSREVLLEQESQVDGPEVSVD